MILLLSFFISHTRAETLNDLSCTISRDALETVCHFSLGSLKRELQGELAGELYDQLVLSGAQIIHDENAIRVYANEAISYSKAFFRPNESDSM